jgi:hypothetical protein
MTAFVVVRSMEGQVLQLRSAIAQQIPCGNDRKKSKCNGRSRFPAGMTERKTSATAEADSLRE